MALEKGPLLLLALGLGLAGAQKALEEVPVQPDFDAQKVEGRWLTLQLSASHANLVSPADPLRLALHSIQTRHGGDVDFVLFWKGEGVCKEANITVHPTQLQGQYQGSFEGGSMHVRFVSTDYSNLVLYVRFEDDEITSLWVLLEEEGRKDRGSRPQSLTVSSSDSSQKNAGGPQMGGKILGVRGEIPPTESPGLQHRWPLSPTPSLGLVAPESSCLGSLPLCCPQPPFHLLHLGLWPRLCPSSLLEVLLHLRDPRKLPSLGPNPACLLVPSPAGKASSFCGSPGPTNHLSTNSRGPTACPSLVCGLGAHTGW
ncbi:beta-lactoglobulin isoform X1 [Macaca fascicularis]|uniref:beta-lactoglobulin isoform X1 n=1 Tax=Macaca fascicularis TaxID=9541 RepID=UPI0032B07F67